MATQAQQMMADSLVSDARGLLGTDAAVGDRKVFLSALLGPVAGQDMSEIHAMWRSGLLELARADFVQGMDPSMVRASEWEVMPGVHFHFVVVPA